MNYKFLNKLKNPDEDFLSNLRMMSTLAPYWMGLIFIFIILIIIFTNVLFGTGSSITKAINWLSKPILYLILPLILIPYIALKIIQFYVSSKLKRKRSRQV